MHRFLLPIILCCALACPAFAQEPKAAKARPKSETPAPAQQLRDAYERTRSISTAEELTEVINVCERALGAKLTPEDVKYGHDLLSWSYNRRGECYAEQAAGLIEKGQQRKANEFDALALDDFHAAVQHDPARFKALHNRGVSLALAGRSKEAISDFNRVIELKPDFVNAWFNRAELRLEQRQWEAAAADYAESLRLKPNDVAAYVGRAKASLQLAQIREALADADRAVQLDANHAMARAVHGDVRLRQGEWEQAASDYQQAVKLDARCALGFCGAAWLMATCPDARYRNAELAVQAAERASKLLGDDFHALDVLAAAQANAGQFADAVRTVARALDSAPEDEAGELARRHDLYAAGKPYRMTGVKASAAKGGSKLR